MMRKQVSALVLAATATFFATPALSSEIDNLHFAGVRPAIGPVLDRIGGASGSQVPRTDILIATRTNLLSIAKDGYDVLAEVFFCNDKDKGILVSDPYVQYKSRHLFDYRALKEDLASPKDGVFIYEVRINDTTWLSPPGSRDVDRSRPIDFNKPPQPICLQVMATAYLWPFPIRSNIIRISPHETQAHDG